MKLEDSRFALGQACPSGENGANGHFGASGSGGQMGLNFNRETLPHWVVVDVFFQRVVIWGGRSCHNPRHACV